MAVGTKSPILQARGCFAGLPVSNAAGINRTFTGGAITSRSYWTFEEDFLTGLERLGTLDGTYDWVETDIGTQTLDPSTYPVADNPNGYLEISSDATDNDGTVLQYTGSGCVGEMIVPAAGRTIAVEYRASRTLWTTTDWFLGLAETSTTLMANTGALNTTPEFVGFHCRVGVTTSGTFDCIYNGASTTRTVTKLWTPTLTAGLANFNTFGIRIEGTDNIKWYLDGQLVAKIDDAADSLGNALCFSFSQCQTNTTLNATRLDYIRAAGTR